MTRVAVCAPATPILPQHAVAITALAAEIAPEVELVIHDQCFASEGHFAGPDTMRLSALLECANDPSFDAVWFARGGYGSNRIAAAAIEGMDDVARQKTFLGYSDCGYLLAAMYKSGIGRPTHGPMVADVGRKDGDAAARRALRWLSDGCTGLEPSLGETPAVAFNLMTLSAILGTELMPDLSGHVVMIEEIAEHLYAVDRLMFHVTSNLSKCGLAGLRLGRVTNVPNNDRPFGSQPEDIVRFWCERHAIDYLGEAEIGHFAGNHIVPFGVAPPLARA
ncbi:putative murein peptide carboxypeptidase [Tsuneonella dongtanensis]|uniref:Putative murein peptide carboxypeptidase n=1 Tax=Tsuneonella dongtanensis TaxID=692370 RepID=A0A1B2AEC9_9SPHN|nr:LD-carboxypeptidase [Tsuneonella dongtanensis]ANY20509.1 putative murein peptide carboxypeptidase [Tsuneonella dongtanensis]